MEFQAVKQYYTNFPGIFKIITCSDNSAWLCNNRTKILKHVSTSGNTLEEITTIPVWYIDVAITHTGDLLFSTEENNLKVIPFGTDIPIEAPNIRVPAGRIVTIHLNEERCKIILGVCMKEYNQQGQIVVLNEEGNHERTYPLFTAPNSIATHKNIIAIVDRADIHTRDSSGRVFILDLDQDKVTNVYKGYADSFMNGSHPFKPYDVVYTKRNTFIVSDTCINNPILHVLDIQGNYLTFCNTRDELGICLPLSLAIDKDGFLFIGSQTYKGSSHANLYVVEIY